MPNKRIKGIIIVLHVPTQCEDNRTINVTYRGDGIIPVFIKILMDLITT